MGVCCATNINKSKLKDKTRESQSHEVSSGQKKPEIQSYENLKSAGSDLQNQSSDNAAEKQRMKLKKNAIFGQQSISKKSQSKEQDSNYKAQNESNLKNDGIKNIFNFGKLNNEDKSGKYININTNSYLEQKILKKDNNKDSAKDQNNEGGNENKEEVKQKKIKKYYNLSPKINRIFRIYKIQGKSAVSVPYSRDSDWQQVLQIYFGKLNLSTFQANQGLMGNPSQVKNKKQQEILSQLEQIQIHREIELMVSILNLRNRNWVQEQIKMNKRLGNISPQSFDYLVVTREFLQFKEHFNWFVWAVSFYYFQMSKIEQFFQYYQQKQIHSNIVEQQQQKSNQPQNQNPNSTANQKLKQQNILFHEINHLLAQVNQLKNKLPSPINKKWSDGFCYQGVNFRMMPCSDGYFIKNEIKALKFIQNELMELSQLQAQMQDQYINANIKQQPSIYKNIILPMLSFVECAGFFIYATPIIYIPGYSDDHTQFQNEVSDQLTKKDKAISHFQMSQRISENDQLDQIKKNRQRTKSVLTNLYGKEIFITKNIIENKLKEDKKQKHLQQAYMFLQDNIDEIEDALLKSMPLLKNMKKQNVIPIIDFEDQTQINLNYYLIHGFDCIPDVEANQESFSQMLLMIPADPMKQIQFLDHVNLGKISFDQVNLFINEKIKSFQNLKLKQQHQKIKSKQKVKQKTNKNQDSNEISDESSNLHESDLSENSDDNLNSRIQSQENTNTLPLLETKFFSKHGFDLITIYQNNVSQDTNDSNFQPVGPGTKLKNNSAVTFNKRACSLCSVKEEESSFDGLFKDLTQCQINIFIQEYNVQINPFVGTQQQKLEQDQLSKSLQAGGGLFNQQKKQSILRKMNTEGIFGMQQANFQQQPEGQFSLEEQAQSQDQNIKGNCLVVIKNYQNEFKLKYSTINHQSDFCVEQIFMKSIQSIAQTIEETDTIYNIQSLKDLLHRKGLNLRFEWLLLTKLKNAFNRQLVMIHILIRTMKKIINEEVKIKAQVFRPNKPKTQNNFSGKIQTDNEKTLAQKIEANILQNDHFIGSNQENFKDNLVFFSNTLLRKKFSKQKHVFDETLISLFLQRLKILPFTHSIQKFSQLIKQKFLLDYEILYLQSKQILEEIIATPSQNPSLFLTSLQQYFQIDIEQEFLRRCRQDKFLFLSKLTNQPMVLNNITNVNLKFQAYYSLKEYSYFMLANTMQQSTVEQQKEVYRIKVLDAEAINQNLRNQIFKNKLSPKKQREKDAQIGGAPGRRDLYFSQNSNKQQIISSEYLNSSSVTDKNKFMVNQNSQNKLQQLKIQKEEKKVEYIQQKQQTPKQFKNIDNIDQREYKDFQQVNLVEQIKRVDKDLNPQYLNSEIIIPPVLYKMNTTIKPFQQLSQDNISTESNFLPYYCMPQSHVFDKWVMYLEHILKDVYSVEGSQQILLEALNYLAITIYFSSGNAFSSQSTKDRSLSMVKKGSSDNDYDYNDYDRDQFIKVCNKIKEYQGFSSKCSPEVIVMSQIICGLSYEQPNDDSMFPIESEKCYLTALLCMFQMFGDPRGRGNYSVPYILFVTWKLGLLPISVENRKVYDAEFSEELFDSTLCNLTNHRASFRKHQNVKLNRAIYQQEMINRQNILNDIGKEGPNQKKVSAVGSQQANFNSRRSHYQGDINELMYKISDFELQMDLQEKLSKQVDIRCIINPLMQNSVKFKNFQEHKSQVFDFQDYSKSNQFDGIKKNEEWNINEQKIGPTYNSKSVFDKSQTQNNARILQEIKRSGLQNSMQPESIKKIIQEDLQNIISKNQTLKKNYDNELGDNFIYNNLPTPIQQQMLKKDDGRAIARNGDKASDPINSLIDINISEIDINLDEQNLQNETEDQNICQFQILNFSEDSFQIPEIPFVHWSIYRQSIQNVLNQQGHKFQKNQKQMNKFLSQMFKKVLFTSIEKKVLRPWLMKYNIMMYQSGTQWKDCQIKQVVVFQTAQMISSRSSSKSSQRNESEFGGLALSMQGSNISHCVANSYRSSTKSQNLGSYSSIINFENGSINKGEVNGILYSWGSDAHGQLGHDTFSHLTQKSVSQKIFYPRMISTLKEEFIKEVCCGYSHTLAITINGNVLSWGNNESCQLGLGPNCPEFVRKPQMIQDLRFIIKLSAGNEHSVAINKNHEIFSWGSMYQTGQNDEQNRHTPQKIQFFKNIKIQQIACGGLHTLALSKDHKLFCWGSTEGGQLGLPTNLLYSLCNNQENAVKIPQQIISLQGQEVTQIACGETHSICLCKDGKIFGWGTSMYGQLGLGFSSDSFEPGQGMQQSKVPEPRLIESLVDEQIQKIFCGATFSLFLTKNGELYGCGMNDVGQLGEDLYSEVSALESAKIGQIQSSDVTIPTQISSLQGIKIQTVACGEAHVLAIDGDGIDSKNMLWAWGQFKNGQLGLGELNIKLNPRPVQNLSSSSIHKIACGSSHSLALVGDPSNLTSLSPNFYSGNEILANSWSIQ